MADVRAAVNSRSASGTKAARRPKSWSALELRSTLTTVLALVVAFIIPWFHGTAPRFVYDAAQYWGGAAALITGHGWVDAGGLTTRGIFTTFIYLPPALTTSLIGPQADVWAVLAWNAALGAIVSVLLIPRLAGLITSSPLSRPPAARIWTSAVVGGIVLSGYARFPLVDIWSIALALAGFYGLAVAHPWWWLSLAGVSLTVAANVRPAMIAPLILGVAVLFVVRARPIAIAIPAGILAIAPQVIFNKLRWDIWSPVPRETVPLSAVQAGPAPYTLRYDTVAFDGQDPRQWYCDPRYASVVAEDPRPHNQIDVIISAFHHLPDSIWFLFRKIAANLRWSLMTPYENGPDPATSPMTVLVVVVSAWGIVALIMSVIRIRSHRRWLVTTLALLAFWIGALATVVFSTPETRFTLPLVLVGLVGLVSVVPERIRLLAFSRDSFIAVGCALLLTVGVLAAGSEAVGHAMPPGPLFDAAECARQ